MEKKVKYRMAGTFVLMALAAILLLLMQSGKGLSPQVVAATKAPTFPDQAIQVTALAASKPPMDDKPTVSPAPEETQQPEAVIKALHPSIVSNSPIPGKQDKNKPDVLKIKPISVEALNNTDVAKLKSAAWVIQLGSFKNKANALRLVNQLRGNGYRAFIQRVDTVLGENTRVFVGPENKQFTARSLATRLEAELHLHAVVISYKPLAL